MSDSRLWYCRTPFTNNKDNFKELQMRILVIHGAHHQTGAARSLLQMMEKMKELYGGGLEITVLLISGAWRQKAEVESLGCHAYRVFYGKYVQEYPYQKWKLPAKYIIRGIEYILGRLLGIRIVEHILQVPSYDLIHSNSFREDLGAILATRHHIPYVCHLREFKGGHFNLFFYRKDYIELMNNTANCIIAVSEAVEKNWIKQGINRNKIKSIYDGVRADYTLSEYTKRGWDKKLKVVALGNISESKRQITLIKACGKLTKEYRERLHVDMFGNGNRSYLKKLNRIIVKEGLLHTVHINGYQGNPDRWMNRYTIGINCSKMEAFGRVTAEYMMAGLAVITSDSGANSELVRNGIDGLLYHQDDEASLAKSLMYCIDHPDKVDVFGRNGRIRAQKEFTIQKNAERIYHIYKESIKNGSERLFAHRGVG